MGENPSPLWSGFDEPEEGDPATAGDTFGDTRSMATWAHVVPIFTGVIGATVMFVVARNKPAFVRHHAAESLNFQITVLIGVVVSALLMTFLIGLLTLVVVVVFAVVVQIVGALRASEGIWWSYPVSLRLVPGALRF